MPRSEKKTVIAVDFDNTIFCQTDVGELVPIPGAKEAMESLSANGFYLIIYSCRTGIAKQRNNFQHEVNVMTSALLGWKIPFHEIFIGEKLVADFYIDDRAVPFRGKWDETVDDLQNMIEEEDSQFDRAESRSLFKA